MSVSVFEREAVKRRKQTNRQQSLCNVPVARTFLPPTLSHWQYASDSEFCSHHCHSFEDFFFLLMFESIGICVTSLAQESEVRVPLGSGSW